MDRVTEVPEVTEVPAGDSRGLLPVHRTRAKMLRPRYTPPRQQHGTQHPPIPKSAPTLWPSLPDATDHSNGAGGRKRRREAVAANADRLVLGQ